MLRTVPRNVVIDLSEFHLDPQVQHNKLVVEHEVGVLGAIRETRPAPLMSETPLRVGGAGPARGEHTAEVLRVSLAQTALRLKATFETEAVAGAGLEAIKVL